MKTSGTNFFVETTDTIFNKTTKAVSVSSFRSVASTLGFTVLADQLHGDHKTVNLHEFRKNYLSNYVGTLFNENSTQTLTRVGNVGAFSNFVNAAGRIDSSNLYNQALGSLLEDLRSDNVGSGLDLAIDIAEGKQVGKMLGDVTKLTKYVMSFSPKNWGKKWLEYQYGWRPLVNSIYGTFDALMHRRIYTLKRVRGKARRFVRSENKFLDQFGFGSVERVFEVGRYRYLIVAEYDLKNTEKQLLSGYTSLNPVGIAWELVPYSFVVDWFYDIGGYLKNMESALLFGTGFVRGYSVYGYKSEQQGILTGSGTSFGITNVWNADAVSRQSYKLRSPIGVFPFPRIPRFESNLGWQRLFSAGSLLSLHLGKGPRGPGLTGRP